jgi:electron transfer flavoprotein beta subunit
MVLMGKQSIDDDSNVVGQMVAEMLGWAQATFASVVKLSDDKQSAVVTREVDGGLEDVEIQLPGVITADLRLNEPRYASLPGIMKARKKELKEIPIADVGVDLTPTIKIQKLEPPRSGRRARRSAAFRSSSSSSTPRPRSSEPNGGRDGRLAAARTLPGSIL